MTDRYFFKKKGGKIVGYFPTLKDGNYEIIEVKKKRSIKQNALYWAYFLKKIVLFHKEIGEVKTVDEIHEGFKKSFLKVRVASDYSKKYIWKKGSTSDLNTKNFKLYMEKINNFYMENFGFSVDLDNVTEGDLLYRENLFV